MKRFFKTLTIVAALFAVVSCESDDNNTPSGDFEAGSNGIYLLNAGGWGDNNSTLDYYNTDTKSYTSDIFTTQNEYGMGDFAQDMVIADDKIFIVAYGSQTLWVTDLNGKVLKSFQDFDGCSKPRKLAASGDYVYIGCYTNAAAAGTGAVVRMSTSDYSMTALDAGSTPEQLAITGDKLYIANCGWGYDNTISVYDIAGGAFTKLDNIVVNYNPNFLVAAPNGKLYVNCWPVYNYDENWNYIGTTGSYVIQEIDPANNNAVTTLDITFDKGNSPVEIAMGKDGILLINSADYNYPPTIDLYAYDTNSGSSSILIGDVVGVNSIWSELTSGNIYIGAAVDYDSTGLFYSYDSTGTSTGKFNAGVNPLKAIEVTE